MKSSQNTLELAEKHINTWLKYPQKVKRVSICNYFLSCWISLVIIIIWGAKLKKLNILMVVNIYWKNDCYDFVRNSFVELVSFRFQYKVVTYSCSDIMLYSVRYVAPCMVRYACICLACFTSWTVSAVSLLHSA